MARVLFLIKGSACPYEKIQRFLSKSMIRKLLVVIYIYISFRSIRLIFNTSDVRPLIYYLIFAKFRSKFILALSFVYRLLLPRALKIRRTTEKYCTLFEKGNMFLGVHIHIYEERGS